VPAPGHGGLYRATDGRATPQSRAFGANEIAAKLQTPREAGDECVVLNRSGGIVSLQRVPREITSVHRRLEN